MKKISQKKALNKLLNILRKHGLIFKSTNEKIIDHLLEYEHMTLVVKDELESRSWLRFQIEHPDYNNLDYIFDWSHSNSLSLNDKIKKALREWESKTEDTVLTH